MHAVLNALPYAQYPAAVFAFLAAALWWKSALVKTPDRFTFPVVKPDPDMPPFGQPLGATYLGHAYSPEMEQLTVGLREQSKWSKGAAAAAGFAALLQAISLLH